MSIRVERTENMPTNQTMEVRFGDPNKGADLLPKFDLKRDEDLAYHIPIQRGFEVVTKRLRDALLIYALNAATMEGEYVKSSKLESYIQQEEKERTDSTTAQVVIQQQVHRINTSTELQKAHIGIIRRGDYHNGGYQLAYNYTHISRPPGAGRMAPTADINNPSESMQEASMPSRPTEIKNTPPTQPEREATAPVNEKEAAKEDNAKELCDRLKIVLDSLDPDNKYRDADAFPSGYLAARLHMSLPRILDVMRKASIKPTEEGTISTVEVLVATYVHEHERDYLISRKSFDSRNPDHIQTIHNIMSAAWERIHSENKE